MDISWSASLKTAASDSPPFVGSGPFRDFCISNLLIEAGQGSVNEEGRRERGDAGPASFGWRPCACLSGALPSQAEASSPCCSPGSGFLCWGPGAHQGLGCWNAEDCPCAPVGPLPCLMAWPFLAHLCGCIMDHRAPKCTAGRQAGRSAPLLGSLT